MAQAAVSQDCSCKRGRWQSIRKVVPLLELVGAEVGRRDRLRKEDDYDEETQVLLRSRWCAMCMALMRCQWQKGGPQAANSVSGSTASGAHEVVIEGEPGDIIVVGDLVFEIIDPEEMEELASQPVPYANTTRWTNVFLSGTEMSKKFEVTSSYPYAKVWISNQGQGDIQFTITRVPILVLLCPGLM